MFDSGSKRTVSNQYKWSTGHTLNGQPLLEFAHPHDLGGGAGTELRVKAATLWVRVDFRSPLHRAFRHNVPDKNLTLWIFTVTQHLHTNTTHLSGKVCCCSVTYNETLPAGEGLAVTPVRTRFSVSELQFVGLLADNVVALGTANSSEMRRQFVPTCALSCRTLADKAIIVQTECPHRSSSLKMVHFCASLQLPAALYLQAFPCR